MTTYNTDYLNHHTPNARSEAYEPYTSFRSPSPSPNEQAALYHDEENARSGHHHGDSPYLQPSYSNPFNGPFDSREDIPLTEHRPKLDRDYASNDISQPPLEQSAIREHTTTPRRGLSKWLNKQTPWVTYIITLIQIIVFIAELVKNAQLTGTPIEIHPSFNPMIGPSPYVLINMGSRYVPCMRNEAPIQAGAKGVPIYFPCPNTTTNTATCSLTELCGNSPAVPDPNNPSFPHTMDQTPAPNQWWRFITPIFLHGGIIHIGANLILQMIIGRDMERAIGPLRFVLVYFSAGIFGFVMGGNFAPSGISSTGCSGSLFGIIGLVFIDLAYSWKERARPAVDLIVMIVVVAISFVIGLLPAGTDNFSHIGGFIMGLVLGPCLLHSPPALRKHTEETEAETRARRRQTLKNGSLVYGTTGQSTSQFLHNPASFFKDRKPLWWVWWLIRAALLVTVIVVFIVLLNDFYANRNECSWCKYLSCLPVNNWCDIGNLTTTTTTTAQTGGSSAGTSSPVRLF